MSTPIQTYHEYDIDTDDGNSHNINTSKSHDHHDYKGDVVKWWNEHGKGYLMTAAKIIAIRKGNRTIWKK